MEWIADVFKRVCFVIVDNGEYRRVCALADCRLHSHLRQIGPLSKRKAHRKRNGSSVVPLAFQKERAAAFCNCDRADEIRRHGKRAAIEDEFTDGDGRYRF